jgi:cytochrome c-type biogenesis protein CcmE
MTGTRIRASVLIAVIALGLGWVATRGLASNLVYYVTPGDVLASPPGERVRLGGYVEPGTVVVENGSVQFTLTDGSQSVTVVQQGAVPSMFKAGRGVVVEGSLGQDGIFHSDTVLVKHDGIYSPPKPGTKPAPGSFLGA